uniref:Conopeptide n=1 Tax=Conus lenavati TaxID=1519839 RepID=A0A0K8TUC8_CONLV
MMMRVFIAMLFLLALTEGWPRMYDKNCTTDLNYANGIQCFRAEQCGAIRKVNGELTCYLKCNCVRGDDCLTGEYINWDGNKNIKIFSCPKPWQ